MSRLRSLALPALAVFVLLAGCGGGVNEQFLGESQARIDMLRAKGVPDDEVSSARVHLHQTREHFTKGNKSLAKRAADSLRVHLEKAEKFYDERILTLGPVIEAAKSASLKAKEDLSGYQAKRIDSTLAVIDSFRKADRPLQANNIAQELVAALPSLREDEQKGVAIRRQLPGEWVFTDKVESVEIPARDAAVTRKSFLFRPDGTIYLVESRRGQSGPYLKEDWEFRSWGTYGLKGDTIMLSINRFAAVRQMFQRIHMRDGRPVWVPEPGPTYDSLITDGSQDRFITFADLKDDFRRAR
ncbi:MAG: hypothetical protein LBC70_07380 [Chitinispirillales bacterium]|jgi:hypothetical protein|nr:hypothetical protein [Chitinispirillales bacterium]